MNKGARKKRLPKKHVIPQKKESPVLAKLQSNKKLMPFAIVAILATIPFALGKHFELNTPGPYDSGAYVYSAKRVVDGAVIGVDEIPSAQLGTLLVNMLGVRLFGFSETGPKLIQGILQAAALVLMFIAIQKLFGTLPAAVSVIVASIYLSAPLAAKFGNVKEQYMIAFMVMAISCFVLRQLGGRWWWAVLAGAFVIWAPLFKQTGVSAMAAIGLFVLIQPVFKHRSWKQTASDIGLLTAGAVIAIAPACIWLLTCHGGRMLPYTFVWRPIISSFTSSPEAPEPKPAESETERNTAQDKTKQKGLLEKLLPGYVAKSWQALEPADRKEVARRIFRYYKLLILPIALAIGAIAAKILRMVRRAGSAKKDKKRDYDRFVFLFAVWWLLDMAFIWISPRSYEQYYLPLNASAAMLGGYLIATYTKLLENPVNKKVWKVVGLIALLVMIGMSWHIFFGIYKSPHTGVIYRNRATGEPEKRRGYAQKLKEIANRKKEGARGPWEVLGDYIRNNSTKSNKIYVWGWVPGIYVQAQRLSSVPEAFEGTMHTLSPEVLSKKIEAMVSTFEKDPPKFIVDTHKLHFPWDRPPLELWPIVRGGNMGMKETGFLPANKQIIDRYNTEYSKMLRQKIEPDEALRYEAMQPLREFVMNNYQMAERSQFVRTRDGRLLHRMFAENVLFVRE
ncbi:MAG: glycosyltransferase family 39 protein [Planctomycetes bacterium]|nr:glycosyltransferase family 39 protein [Planctomycetota bacterium]